MNPRARFVRQFPLGAATIVLIGTVLITGLSLTTGPSHAQATRDASTPGSGACIGDNGGITLSPGFCATVFADKLGHARHLVVTPNGVVYVNTWSGRYYHDDTPPPGGFLIALQDTKGDGGADKIVRFGPTKAEGNAGEPASLSTTATSMPRRTTASFATSCHRMGSSRPQRRRRSCRDCR